MIVRFCIKAILTFFLVSNTGQVLGDETKVLQLVSNEWPPYSGDHLSNKGLASDIVGTALGRAGYEVSFKIVPWTRALKGVSLGTYDGLYTAWYNEKRAETMAYSDHFMVNEVVFFKQKSKDISYSTLNDLKQYQFGITRDYAYSDEFDNHMGLNKKSALDLRTNIVRLANGRVDLFPEDKFVMLYTIENNHPEYRGKIDFIEKPLSQRKLHMTISRATPNYEQIIANFNRELKAMKAEGLIDVMIKKYNIKD